MRTTVERVRNAVAQGTRSRASPNAHQGKNHRLQQFQEQSDELGQENFRQEAPGTIFETQDRRQYPPNGFLMEDGSNPNIKVGQTGLSKAAGGGSLFRR
jgi:hypothetical protein